MTHLLGVLVAITHSVALKLARDNLDLVGKDVGVLRDEVAEAQVVEWTPLKDIPEGKPNEGDQTLIEADTAWLGTAHCM